MQTHRQKVKNVKETLRQHRKYNKCQFFKLLCKFFLSLKSLFINTQKGFNVGEKYKVM